MNMFDMMGKARDLQKKMQEVQQSLASQHVSAQAADGKLSVEASGARRLTAINIDSDLLQTATPAALQRYIITAVNQALDKADELAAAEMKSQTSGMLPNIPGLNLPGFGG